ncbi:5-oxoprolinase subunit PxpB [Melghirimyces algeriensis]|nr:5-oxoprolinase subunit PxpB [Melghirimyces algeriensis]
MKEKWGYEVSPLGDTSVIVQFGTGINEVSHRNVLALTSYFEEHPFPGMIEIVPAFTTVTIFYDPMKLYDPFPVEERKRTSVGSPYDTVCSILERIVPKLDRTVRETERVIHIPVCYGGELGPDLDEVARSHHMTADEVIEIHSGQEYLVYMIGFAPGFPYLGGMSERIATPRRRSPRMAIPAGAVGIGGSQTGIYPISTPGGWQIIGRTPLRLFRPEHQTPSLLKAGDKVRFQPIGLDQYKEWNEDQL